MKIKLSKSQWEAVGQKAGWIKKEAQGASTAQEIAGAFSGLNAGAYAEGREAKAKEYADRIMKGEPKEEILQGQHSIMVQLVEKYLSQLSGQASPQAAQQPKNNAPASTPASQYSLSKSVQWADSTKDPSIMDFVSKTNTGVQKEGVQKYTSDLNLIMKAMAGDQTALQQLKQRSGGQAIPK